MRIQQDTKKPSWNSSYQEYPNVVPYPEMTTTTGTISVPDIPESDQQQLTSHLSLEDDDNNNVSDDDSLMSNTSDMSEHTRDCRLLETRNRLNNSMKNDNNNNNGTETKADDHLSRCISHMKLGHVPPGDIPDLLTLKSLSGSSSDASSPTSDNAGSDGDISMVSEMTLSFSSIHSTQNLKSIEKPTFISPKLVNPLPDCLVDTGLLLHGGTIEKDQNDIPEGGGGQWSSTQASSEHESKDQLPLDLTQEAVKRDAEESEREVSPRGPEFIWGHEELKKAVIQCEMKTNKKVEQDDEKKEVESPPRSVAQKTPQSRKGSARSSRSGRNTSRGVRSAGMHGRRGDFDVNKIETGMPNIDWAAMEAHLARAAKENDYFVRRNNDREEIRKKLAMDSDSDEYYCGEKVSWKPSLSTRLQSGMNLQICFMNETASDQESTNGENEVDNNSTSSVAGNERNILGLLQQNDCLDKSKVPNKLVFGQEPMPQSGTLSNNNNGLTKQQRPSFFFNRQKSWRLGNIKATLEAEKSDRSEDFLTRHARLQKEARMALGQAKEMARMQMEVERQSKKKSPIAEIVGFPLPDGRHRLTRHGMNEMNVAQLQVIVNDLHSQIESLNEELVHLLLERDDLHMEQDSMLVDIEDLTRYLGAKDEANKNVPGETSVLQNKV